MCISFCMKVEKRHQVRWQTHSGRKTRLRCSRQRCGRHGRQQVRPSRHRSLTGCRHSSRHYTSSPLHSQHRNQLSCSSKGEVTGPKPSRNTQANKHQSMADKSPLGGVALTESQRFSGHDTPSAIESGSERHYVIAQASKLGDPVSCGLTTW